MSKPREAALEYVRAGWPVAPVWPLVEPPGRSRLRRRPSRPQEVTCSCPAGASCPNPGAHLAAAAVTSETQARLTWSEGRWNVALQAGQVVDVIEAGTALGAQAMRLLEWQPSPYPPVAHTGTRRWLFVVQACSDAPDLPARAIWHGDGSWVLLPPSSRGLSGCDRWIWTPKTTKPMPASQLAAALQAVGLHDWEVGADDFPEHDPPTALGPLAAAAPGRVVR